MSNFYFWTVTGHHKCIYVCYTCGLLDKMDETNYNRHCTGDEHRQNFGVTPAMIAAVGRFFPGCPLLSG